MIHFYLFDNFLNYCSFLQQIKLLRYFYRKDLFFSRSFLYKRLFFIHFAKKDNDLYMDNVI